MRIGIVTDAACDLPQEYRQAHNILTLPIGLKFGEVESLDTRDPEETKAFFARYSIEKDTNAETRPLDVDEVADLFLNKWVLEYDRLLVITVAQSRSAIYENTTRASFKILKEYRQRRQQAGLDSHFAMRVMDSQTMFTGQAVLVQEAVRLIESGMAFDKLRPAIEELTNHVYAFLVPDTLYYVYNRGKERGDRSVSWLAHKLGTLMDVKPIIQMHRGETVPIAKYRGFDETLEHLFDKAREEINRGLRTRTIAMSFAGDPVVIRKRDDYREFCLFAKTSGIETTLSVMSTTAGINVGPGAFAMAYVASD
jgi:DegV family protein with EDD domain